MADKPSVMQRARLALSIFSKGLPWETWGRRNSSVKSSPLAWPSFRVGEPQWSLIDYQAYVEEGFNLNSLIYSAIMYKARATMAAPLRAYKGDPDNPEACPPNHPLAQLAERPNKHQSGPEFEMVNRVYFNLAGENFIHFDRPRGGGVPIAMRALRPDRMKIIPDNKGSILGFLYIPEGKIWRDGVPLLPQDVMHTKLPNPGSPLEGWGHGLSPISPLAHSADVDNYVTKFLKLFFERGTMMSVAISYPESIDPDEIPRIRERWNEVYGSYENWTEVGILDHGAKVERLGMGFDEMGFQGIDERNESRILAPFGVPPILIGSRIGLQRATYANYREARTAFWEDTFLPELNLFAVDYKYFLNTEDGAWIEYDKADVPALRQDVPALITAASEMFQMGVPANVAFQTVGLPVAGDIPGGDQGYIPISLSAVGEPKPEPAPPTNIGGADAEEDEDEEDGDEGKSHTKSVWSMEQKQRVAQIVRTTADSWERHFADAAEGRLEADKRAILALLSKLKQKALAEKATVAWDEFMMGVDAYLGGTKGGDEWRAAYDPLIKGLISDQATNWNAILGAEFDVRNLWAEQWFEEYSLDFAQPINKTTSDTIGRIAQQAEREGWSIPKMQRNLDTTFDQWIKGDLKPDDFAWLEERMPQHRTELIARTETMRASNVGSERMFTAMGAKKKEWLASIDGRERETHAEASRKYSEGGDPGPIPIDQAFSVGGYQMRQPGDMGLGAPLGEVANCRCAVLPYIEKEVELPEAAEAADEPVIEVASKDDANQVLEWNKYEPSDVDAARMMGSDRGRVRDSSDIGRDAARGIKVGTPGLSHKAKGEVQGIMHYKESKTTMHVMNLASAPWNAGFSTDPRKVKGVGSSLMRELFRIAKQKNKARVTLGPLPGAVPFYEAVGFKFIGRTSTMNINRKAMARFLERTA